jgi:hydroxymethylbilane synthase
MTQTLRIATRKSALALWQTEHVAARLRALHPALEIELVPLSTRGDEVLDRSLAAVGGKGLFLKELEEAMLREEADLAVHSLKDVPMELDGPFELPAVLERANPFDAFVSNLHASIEALPEGARVGTSSLRRRAQVLALRPDLDVIDLRGNVNTRLAKLDAGDYAAIVLACAGLERLGFSQRIRDRLAPPTFLPAASQGVIAIECRAGDARVIDLLAPLDHAQTRACIEAERAMNRALGGSCQSAIAAYCEHIEEGLRLRGWVGGADGQGISVELRGPVDRAQSMGTEAADALRAQGAERLLGSAAG